MKSNNLEELLYQNIQAGVRYPFYVIADKKVVRLTRDENSGSYTVADRVCNYIVVKTIKNNLDTREKICVLEYINLSGEREEKEVPVEMLADKCKIVSLSKFGLDISSSNAKYVVNHLNNEMRKAVSIKATNNVGIVHWGNDFIYVGDGAFRAKDSNWQKLKISYSGKLSVQKNGSYEKYLEMLNKEVVGNCYLSTALALGCSSLLVGFMGEKCQVNNLFVHFSGDSSTGKSTAIQLAISAFGGLKNEGGRNSLFTTWNTTDNALQEMLAGNYGVPVGLDEAGMSQNKSFASLIYRLVEGKEKQRLDFGSGNREVREWRTTILSTAEFPLEDISDQATGQKIRLLSFENVLWTKSAEQSEFIKRTIRENYGHLGEKVAKVILKHNHTYWMTKHEEEVQILMKQLKCGELSKRVAGSLAIITLTAHILNRKGITVNVNEIREFLVATINDTLGEKTSIGERAYQELCAEITRKQNYVEIRAKNGNSIQPIPVGEVWGVGYTIKNSTSYSPVDEFDEIAIPEVYINQFLRETGFKNAQLVYKHWAKEGRLRLTKRGSVYHPVRIGGVKNVRCLRFCLS